jgi:hypothetical protein
LVLSPVGPAGVEPELEITKRPIMIATTPTRTPINILDSLDTVYSS